MFMGEWNWIGAERSLQRALEASPDHTQARVLYGRLLEAQGRVADGLAMKLRALDTDPFSPAVHLAIALSYWNQRRFDDAIQWANKTLALDPAHGLAREFLAGAYWALGDFDRHMAETLAHAAAHGVPAIQLALLHAELGELDDALAHLERALDARDPCLVDLAVSPQWDAFRGDARFQQCLANLGVAAPHVD